VRHEASCSLHHDSCSYMFLAVLFMMYHCPANLPMMQDSLSLSQRNAPGPLFCIKTNQPIFAKHSTRDHSTLIYAKQIYLSCIKTKQPIFANHSTRDHSTLIHAKQIYFDGYMLASHTYMPQMKHTPFRKASVEDASPEVRAWPLLHVSCMLFCSAAMVCSAFACSCSITWLASNCARQQICVQHQRAAIVCSNSVQRICLLLKQHHLAGISNCAARGSKLVCSISMQQSCAARLPAPGAPGWTYCAASLQHGRRVWERVERALEGARLGGQVAMQRQARSR